MLAAACGARTGVSADDPPERDADPGFDTFPCRWSLTQPTPIARSAGTFGGLSGGVHGVRDEAVVSARDGVEPLTVRLALGDPARILLSAPVGAEAWLGHASGYIGKPDEGCRLERWSSELEPLGELTDYTVFTRCILEPTDPMHLDMTVISAETYGAVREDVPSGVISDVLFMPGRGYARSVRHGTAWTVLSLEDRTLFAERTGDGAFGTLTRQEELFEASIDRVRAAVVVLRRDPGGIWRLERIPVDQPLALVPLADLSRLSAEPFGTMVTNETEALIPLRDGRVAVAPLDGSAVRFIGPVPEAPVTELVVVMRPGSSGGGLLYTHEGGRTLTFRSLTCNR